MLLILALLIHPEPPHLLRLLLLRPLQFIRSFTLLGLHLLSYLLHFLLVPRLLILHLLVMPFLHILHVCPQLFHFLIVPALCASFVIVHLFDFRLVLCLDISRLLDGFFLTPCLVLIQLLQLFRMVSVSLLQGCSGLLLHLFDLIQMFLLFLKQGLVILLLSFLRIRVFICLFVEIILINLVHLRQVLFLLLCNFPLEVLNLFSKPFNFAQRLIVFGFVRLRVDRDLLAQFDYVGLEAPAFVLRGLDVSLVVFDLFLDVGESGQLVIQSDQRRLHPFDLRITIPDRELQTLDLLMQRLNLSRSCRRPRS